MKIKLVVPGVSGSGSKGAPGGGPIVAPMRKAIAGVVSVSIFISLVILASPTSANVITNGDLVLTLPESVAISGTELGSSTNPRRCSIKASLDSKPGTFIPLRAGAVVSFRDSTDFQIDSGYAVADVEGLTHLDIVMVFKCGNGSGTATLKGPYKFSTIWRGFSGPPFTPDIPVIVTFGGSSSEPSPAPTPLTSKSESPTPTPTPTVTVTATSSVDSQRLLAEVQALKAQVSVLKIRIKKICGVKPKPKGC
jgi:hypothetical protein